MRLDKFLHTHYGVQSRNKASELIKSQKVTVNANIISKPSFIVEEGMSVVILEDDLYVSRAAYKLKYFLQEHPSLTIENRQCLDIGSSTGGFAQILLAQGATSITCVDVGSNQLHTSLQNNPKIKLFEKCDIREFEAQNSFEVVTCDVSFISLHYLLKTIDSFASGAIILLFKPQFEVGKEIKRDAKGAVKDNKAIAKSKQELIKACQKLGWRPISQSLSQIEGKNGNKEEFFYFEK